MRRAYRPGNRSGGTTAAFWRFLSTSCAAATLSAGLTLAAPAHAQDTQIIHPGSMAVTGFSGTHHPRHRGRPASGRRPGRRDLHRHRNARRLRIFDVSARSAAPPTGQLVYTPPPFEVLAEQIGQVFALTYDDGVRDGALAGVPNLYAGATSLHGIRDRHARRGRRRPARAAAPRQGRARPSWKASSPRTMAAARARSGRSTASPAPCRCLPRSTPTAVPASATSASTRRTASSSPPTSTPA